MRPPLVLGLAPLRHDPDALRDGAEQLLSRPPYPQEAPGPIGRALARLGELVAEALSRAVGPVAGNSLIAWVVVAVGAALLALVVWRATRGMRLDRRTASAAESVPTRSAADWHAAADAHAARGALTEAVRCRYGALVAALLEAGIVEDRPGRTVRELDAEVAVADAVHAPAVRDAGVRFEAIVYGRVPATAEDLEVVTRAARVVARGRAAAVHDVPTPTAGTPS